MFHKVFAVIGVESRIPVFNGYTPEGFCNPVISVIHAVAADHSHAAVSHLHLALELDSIRREVLQGATAGHHDGSLREFDVPDQLAHPFPVDLAPDQAVGMVKHHHLIVFLRSRNTRDAEKKSKPDGNASKMVPAQPIRLNHSLLTARSL